MGGLHCRWIGHFGEASHGSTEAQPIDCSQAAWNHWYSPKNVRVTNLIWQLLYQDIIQMCGFTVQTYLTATIFYCTHRQYVAYAPLHICTDYEKWDPSKVNENYCWFENHDIYNREGLPAICFVSKTNRQCMHVTAWENWSHGIIEGILAVCSTLPLLSRESQLFPALIHYYNSVEEVHASRVGSLNGTIFLWTCMIHCPPSLLNAFEGVNHNKKKWCFRHHFDKSHGTLKASLVHCYISVLNSTLTTFVYIHTYILTYM